MILNIKERCLVPTDDGIAHTIDIQDVENSDFSPKKALLPPTVAADLQSAERDFIEIHSEKYSKSLSEADKSVLHIANKIDACILSSDKTLRNYAKNKIIECHGMIWIFDKLVETSILTKKEAANKLTQLVNINYVFQNNPILVEEIEKRLKKWHPDLHARLHLYVL